MNIKNKSLIFSFFIIIIIQILLLINNKQKTSFRYFIWNIQDVSIGRLISISFISGLLISNILNKTLHNHERITPESEKNDQSTFDNEDLKNKDDNNESYEIPPERDLRDSQPTISVNYRIIKDNGENNFKDRNQTPTKPIYQDDWNNNNSEW